MVTMGLSQVFLLKPSYNHKLNETAKHPDIQL